MNSTKFSLLLLLAGCAGGPRPVPASSSAVERLAMAESALLSGQNLTATFEIDAKGENAAHITGTLDLIDGNAMHLVAEGNYKSDPVQLELDSRDASGITRTTTKGANVSSHRDPPAARLREAVTVGLARMGLLHNLVKLSLDQPMDKVEGGIIEWVRPIDLKDGASESINGEVCHRVDFTVQVEGVKLGEASVCIADSTGLPLQRNQTVHFPAGDMTEVETFKWQVK